MKPTAYAALFLGLVSAALGQTVTLAPSPTESVGCTAHGDHWHCDGPRVTSASTTSSATHDEDDHDHEEHTDTSGTASLKPSPTESYGCEPHGDHWHCEGPITASVSGSGLSTLLTTTAPTGTSSSVSTASPSVSTAVAARYEVAGMGFAGLAVAAAMAL